MSAQDAQNVTFTEAVSLRSLAADWRDWSRIVRLFATRHSRLQQLVPGEYQVLHSEILRQLQALASTGDENRRKEFQEMEKLARPWCSLESFHGADRELLFLLLEECKSAQRFLDCQIRPAWLSPRAVLLAGCVVLGVGFATLLVSGHVGGGVSGYHRESHELGRLGRGLLSKSLARGKVHTSGGGNCCSYHLYCREIC